MAPNAQKAAREPPLYIGETNYIGVTSRHEVIAFANLRDIQIAFGRYFWPFDIVWIWVSCFALLEKVAV